ncbi:LysR family transcriptional regulator [Xanthobacter versatilis]|uniref:Transcriptional regulator, LysR family n=1 Tax=Xanthobacter autotrophicus (strain ATCC BAA-1158 / Py2) TaxID=78245 RepID=A7IHY6_XANP2|nr:transcriptional regulator, LysR family [Xanthobacter autotrophicus Py2]
MRFERLDLNLIVLFDSLLKSENVSRTARQLHLTQPTVSNALARLRRHFDDELFVMVGRKLEPTPLAIDLREPVAKFIHLSRVIAQKRSVFDPETTERTFSIVASDYIASVLLTRVGRRLVSATSHVNLRHVPISAAAIQKFLQGTYDFLVAPGYVYQNWPNTKFLFADRFVVIACRDNTEVGSQLTLDEFLNHPLAVCRFGDLSQPSVVEEFLMKHDCEHSARVECESFGLLVDYIVGTPMLASLPLSYARMRVQRSPIRLVTPMFDMPVIRQQILWHGYSESEPAARLALEMIEQEAADLGE